MTVRSWSSSLNATLYQACNKAERAATKAGVNVRAFLQEMEAVRWLTG
jgi:hypothetical protein